MKTEWTWDEALYDGQTIEEEILETTRWGTLERRVFGFEGVTYEVTYRCEPEEGVLTDYGDPEVYEVEPEEVTVTKWVRRATKEEK